jgi:hypothetical protein
MSDVEDRLRSLLHNRVATPLDNPARRTEVRSRISTIRRRRVAGTALGLVLVAVAGLLVLVKLPGRNESLPAGVPKPPYFTEIGKPKVVGYLEKLDETSSDTGHGMTLLNTGRNQYRPYLVVAWCSRPGVIHLSVPVGPVGDVQCKTRVDDHFEGALAVTSADGDRLFVLGRNAAFTATVRADGAGDRWRLAVLRRDLPDQLPDRGSSFRPLVDGARDPDGGTFRFTVPRPAGDSVAFAFMVECIEGVALTFSVPAGELATARCEPGALVSTTGQVLVQQETVARFGLRPGQTVLVTVRASGRDTDQWRVNPRPQQ